VVARLRDARDAAEVDAAIAAVRAWLAGAELGAPRTAGVLARVLAHALGTAPEHDHGRVAALAELLAATDLRPLVDAALAGTAPSPEDAGTDALLVLQCVTPAAVPLVIERLAEAQTLETRRRCCDLLLALGSGIDLLVAALDDPRWYLARNAALLLGELQAEDAVRLLARMLASADLRVRVAAAGALAQIGNVPALHALCGALDDRAVEVRQIAARGVADAARRGAFVVAATCIAALERQDDADVSLELIAALGRIGSGDAMRYLRQTATGRNRFVGQPELRSAAIGAVVDARTPAAKDAQRALAVDPDPAVRRITAEYWHRGHRPAA
jgi:hypothetical protein